MLNPDAPVIDEALFASEVVRVGRFRCPFGHATFETASSPTDDYCFVFPRVAVTIEHEGRPAFVADANTIPMYNAGQQFRRRAVHGGSDVSDWFALDPALLRDMVAERDGRASDAEEPLRFGFTRADAPVYLRQRQLYRYVRQTPRPDALLIEEAVIKLAADILDSAYRYERTLDAGRDSQTHRALAQRTREYLALTFEKNVSLATLARAAGASVFHLCRVFKAQTGLTIHQYRTELRVRHSLELLEKQPGDILAAALRLGFSGHSHYTRTFHALFGLPPSAFTSSARNEGLRGKKVGGAVRI